MENEMQKTEKSLIEKKSVKLIMQAKGGVGKSLLTWLIANNEKDNTNVLFIDLDESTKTSSARLKSIVGEDRIKSFKILDDNKKLEREKIISLFESLAGNKYSQIVIDFGAPESEEFKRLLDYDISAEELKEALLEFGIDLQIYVVIAGNDAFASSNMFLRSLLSIVNNAIQVNALINVGTFVNENVAETNLSDIKAYQGIKNAYMFGNIGNSQSGKDIINMITRDSKLSDLGLMGKIRFNKVLKEVAQID